MSKTIKLFLEHFELHSQCGIGIAFSVTLWRTVIQNVAVLQCLSIVLHIHRALSASASHYLQATNDNTPALATAQITATQSLPSLDSKNDNEYIETLKIKAVKSNLTAPILLSRPLRLKIAF